MPAALPPPAHAPAAATPAPVYGFAGSPLGQTLADWRAAKPIRTAMTCPPQPKHPEVAVCRGADVSLGGGFYARQVDYVFVGERLSRISFRSSIDAFNYVTANLKGRFNGPNAIVRDTIKDSLTTRDHVAMRWRNGRSTILLSDPLPNTTQLEVRFTLDAAAAQLKATGRS